MEDDLTGEEVKLREKLSKCKRVKAPIILERFLKILEI